MFSKMKGITVAICLLYVFEVSCESLVILSTKTSTSNPQTVSCDVDKSNLTDNLTWRYTNSKGDVTMLDYTAISFNITSKNAAGMYECFLNNETISTVTAAYLATPVIQNTRESVTFNDGDLDRKLTCLSEGSYPSVEFEWSRRGESDDEVSVILSPETSSNININTSSDRSTVMFYNMTYDMQGYYICDVKNVAGNGTAEVLIRVKDRLAALWPFLGIVAEVVILISIIFIYEKQSKKKSAPVDIDNKDEAERPLQDSEDATELRNRAPNNNYKI